MCNACGRFSMLQLIHCALDHRELFTKLSMFTTWGTNSNSMAISTSTFNSYLLHIMAHLRRTRPWGVIMFEEPRRFMIEMDISGEYGVLLCPAQVVSFMCILLNTPQSFRRGCEIFTVAHKFLHPHPELLLKSDVDRGVKAGEKFKRQLAHSHTEAFRPTPDWQESGAESQRNGVIYEHNYLRSAVSRGRAILWLSPVLHSSTVLPDCLCLGDYLAVLLRQCNQCFMW